MTPLAITGAIFAVMLLLMALRTPIAIAMFVAGSLGYVAQAGWGPFSNFLNAQAFARFASYDLSVIPLFILMGNFASQGGISKALFEFASVGDVALSRRPGDGGGARLGRVRRDLRLVGRDRGDDHLGRAARDAPPRLLRGAWPPARSPPAARSAS